MTAPPHPQTMVWPRLRKPHPMRDERMWVLHGGQSQEGLVSSIPGPQLCPPHCQGPEPHGKSMEAPHPQCSCTQVTHPEGTEDS